MIMWELIKMALRTIMGNPLRTFLTMLGVIIGVCSVVTLVSVGAGSSAKVAEQIEGLGSNLLVVNVRNIGRATELDISEFMKLENFPEFKAIAPTVSTSATVKMERTSETYTVIGTNDRYMSINKASMDTGRFLSANDDEFRTNVAVLGSEVAKTLFGFLDPVGEKIKINGVLFTVIGKLAEKGSSVSGTSIDSNVIVPLSTGRRQLQMGSIRSAYIEAATKDDIDQAEATVTSYLTYKFKSSDGFTVLNQNELIDTASAVSSELSNLMAGTACISLLVGGIGIMNIMLVTVSERTREIGIRKSIGAKRRNILFQFLVESTVISALGGAIGLLLSFALAYILPIYFTSMSMLISPLVTLGAFSFSLVVGVVFGLYPAGKASKLRPIDALRYD